jgi:hypothetical protein
MGGDKYPPNPMEMMRQMAKRGGFPPVIPVPPDPRLLQSLSVAPHINPAFFAKERDRDRDRDRDDYHRDDRYHSIHSFI